MNISVQVKSSVRNSHKEKILSWYMPNMREMTNLHPWNFCFYSEEEFSIPSPAHRILKYSSKKKNSSFFFFSSQKKALPQTIEKRVA